MRRVDRFPSFHEFRGVIEARRIVESFPFVAHRDFQNVFAVGHRAADNISRFYKFGIGFIGGDLRAEFFGVLHQHRVIRFEFGRVGFEFRAKGDGGGGRGARDDEQNKQAQKRRDRFFRGDGARRSTRPARGAAALLLVGFVPL